MLTVQKPLCSYMVFAIVEQFSIIRSISVLEQVFIFIGGIRGFLQKLKNAAFGGWQHLDFGFFSHPIFGNIFWNTIYSWTFDL